MKKIGVIYCSYGMPELLHKSLSPWIEARKTQLCDTQWVIAAVSVPFKEYENVSTFVKDEITPVELDKLVQEDKIDFLVHDDGFFEEKDARNGALIPLLEAGCTEIILLDNDEVYQISDIEGVINYSNLNKWESWFSFSLKNFVFDESTYLVERFCPPRLFRVNTNGYAMIGFYFDNDIAYKGIINKNGQFEEVTVSYRDLPHRNIPVEYADIMHLTWIDNARTRAKIAYQMSHFKGVCSYWVNPESDKLEFNPLYYQMIGKDMPKTETLGESTPKSGN